MKNKLVTLAIRTYQRAQMIKNELEKNGIETLIHNLNVENPESAVGVRVRIKEGDLPVALGIVEKIENAWEKESNSGKSKKKNVVLIPVDINDKIKDVCKYGFYFAQELNCEIVFLHAYCKPVYNISSNSDIPVYTLSDTEMLRRNTSQVFADIDNMKNLIEKWIIKKDIPELKYTFILKEGIADEVIKEYCRKNKPYLLVMGTRGKNNTSDDTLGSVTAEVVESCKTPTVAVPVNGKFKQPYDVEKIAFFTNFEQKDLAAIEHLISMYKNPSLELIIIHTSIKKDAWEEVMLLGIKNYVEKKYPAIKTSYRILNDENNLDQIQYFLSTYSIDLLALNTKKRNIFVRFIHQGIATKMLYSIEAPLLVMHF